MSIDYNGILAPINHQLVKFSMSLIFIAVGSLLMGWTVSRVIPGARRRTTAQFCSVVLFICGTYYYLKHLTFLQGI